MTHFSRATLIGTGMIGGSLALALRKAGVVKHWIGSDTDGAELERAKAIGIIDQVAPSPAAAAANADLLLLAMPVGATEEVCRAISSTVPSDCLVTDVGSTKGDVLAQVARALPYPERFVGGHPLAGSEQSGCDVARADLFSGKLCLLTPTKKTRPTSLLACRELWIAAGARVQEMATEEHDRALAWVSHLPHAVAFALASSVGNHATANPLLRGLFGGGFVDTTRIAASNPKMWSDIFLANRAHLVDSIEAFAGSLGQLRQAIEAGNRDTIQDFIEAARAGRSSIVD